MLYVVTGFPRSGTSMLMRCLAFAGIGPVISPLREQAMSKRNQGDYPANPHGFYEVDEREVLRIGFLGGIEDNRAIKLLPTSTTVIPARPTTVIWMHRDTDELRRSYERTFPEENFDKKFPNWPKTHFVQRDAIMSILQDRQSINLIEMWYDEVIEDPVYELAAIDGIDAFEAAKAVDPSLYRNK